MIMPVILIQVYLARKANKLVSKCDGLKVVLQVTTLMAIRVGSLIVQCRVLE